MKKIVLQILGGLLFAAVLTLVFGIIIAGTVGWIDVGVTLIVPLVALLFLVGIVLLKEPEDVIRHISDLVSKSLSDSFQERSKYSDWQPDESRKPRKSDNDGFDRIVGVAEQESTVLADQLRRMRAEFDDITCESVAQTLEVGYQTQKNPPMSQVIQQMETLLNSREFVENSESLELRVIDEDNSVLYARLTEDHGKPKEGLEFDLYIEDTVNTGGDAVVLPKQAGTVKVTLIEEEFCGLEVTSWTDHFQPDTENRISYIMDRNPTAKFDEEILGGIEWRELEQAYKNLKQLAMNGGTTNAN